MKKNFILLFLAVFAASCSDSFTENNLSEDVSNDQIQELANASPEGLLNVTEGLEAGNYFFLNDFNTGSNGGRHDDYGQKAVDLNLDLMTNDMVMTQNNWHGTAYNYTARQVERVLNNMTWKFYYKVIFNMNSTIKLIPESTSVQDLIYLKARCRAMRAFAYFQLIRIYGNGSLGIPYYSDNASQTITGRADVSIIKSSIETDLLSAYNNIGNYTRTTKFQLNKKVIAGLLARYYLEYGDYPKAISYAQEARQGTTLMANNAISILDSGWDGFSSVNNNEWIWGQEITAANSTIYASFFSQIGSLNPGYAGLLFSFKSGDSRLISQIPTTDKRRNWFKNSSTPTASTIPTRANLKFYDPSGASFTGDYVYMRAAEMYLIEAEANFLNGNEGAAKTILTELVSTRHTTYNNASLTGVNLRDHIRFQRRLELWGEGFAFFDMKRWNLPLVRTYSGSNHAAFGLIDHAAGSTKFIYQIPEIEMLNNPSITENNPF